MITFFLQPILLLLHSFTYTHSPHIFCISFLSLHPFLPFPLPPSLPIPVVWSCFSFIKHVDSSHPWHVCHISENALSRHKTPDKSGPAHPTSAWERIVLFEVFLGKSGQNGSRRQTMDNKEVTGRQGTRQKQREE